MISKASTERAGYSPSEFAALFGKSQTWGYRQIYAGRVTAITEFGRLMIPASEIEKILATAERYEGLKKPANEKRGSDAAKARMRSAWQRFIENKRNGAGKPPTEPVASGATRQAILARLAKARKPVR